MKTNRNNILIIQQYLDGTLDHDKINDLLDWVNESDNNRRIFDVQNERQQIQNSPNYNVDKSWEILERLISREELSLLYKKAHSTTTHIHPSIFQSANSLFGRLAAACILVLFLVTSFLYSELNEMKVEKLTTVVVPKGEKAQVILPDQSTVWLNSGSSLTYSSTFGHNNRNVKLRGEGYFEVQKNKKKFIVDLDVSSITVLGTSFNVCSYSDDPDITTTLLTGSVLFETKKWDSSYIMEPDHQIILEKSTGKMSIQKVDPSISSSWTQRILKFDNAPLLEVMRKAERWYNVHIIFDSTIQNSERCTMTINGESLKEFMELLKLTTPINYTIKNDKVFMNIRK